MIAGVNYTIHDNFLPEQDFNILRDYMLSNNFPWYYTSPILRRDIHLNKDIDKNNDFLFSHLFYNDGFVTSPQISCLSSLISKINPLSLLRVKANMYSRTTHIVQHGWHTDYNNVNFKTAVFYINTNDGKTIFKDGLEVESIANRLVEFDTNLYHCSTTCTDEKVRCNINLNYVPAPAGCNINYKSYLRN